VSGSKQKVRDEKLRSELFPNVTPYNEALMVCGRCVAYHQPGADFRPLEKIPVVQENKVLSAKLSALSQH